MWDSSDTDGDNNDVSSGGIDTDGEESDHLIQSTYTALSREQRLIQREAEMHAESKERVDFIRKELEDKKLYDLIISHF